jgi:TM2 domain-containing membrane protein YozV
MKNHIIFTIVTILLEIPTYTVRIIYERKNQLQYIHFYLPFDKSGTGREQWLSQGVGRGFLTVLRFQGLHKIYRGKFRFQQRVTCNTG